MRDCGVLYLTPDQKEAQEKPNHVASLVNWIQGRERGSPRLTAQEIIAITERDRFRYYYAESEVEQFVSGRLFPCSNTQFMRTDRLPMAKHTIPLSQTSFNLQLTNPIPDMIYGYEAENSFTEGQRALLPFMGQENPVNSVNLMLPFLVIEFKGADGSLWVAENQALCAAAACIKVAESLMEQLTRLSRGPINRFDTCAFSIAMNGELARLYISWRNDGKYFATTVRSYLLLDPAHYTTFRDHVRNIIAWGRNTRLNQITNTLDNILEASRREQARRSKSRPPPGDSSPAKRQELDNSSQEEQDPCTVQES